MKNLHKYLGILIFILVLFGCKDEIRECHKKDDTFIDINDIYIHNGEVYLAVHKFDSLMLCRFELNQIKILDSYKFLELPSDYCVTNSSILYDVPPTFFFIKDFTGTSTSYIIKNQHLFSINNKSKANLPLNFDYNINLQNNIAYFTVNYDRYKYFNMNHGYNIDLIFEKYKQARIHQYYIRYNMITNQADTLHFWNKDGNSKLITETADLLKFSFNIEGKNYVCTRNKIINIENKNSLVFNEIGDDEIVTYYQKNNSEITFTTFKGKIITYQGDHNYSIIDFNSYKNQVGITNNDYMFFDICKRDNHIYGYLHIGIREGQLTKVIKLDINSQKVTNLFTFDQAFSQKYNYKINQDNSYTLTELSRNAYLETDDNGNVYFGTNGLFIFDKNDSLSVFYPASDLSKMIYKSN